MTVKLPGMTSLGIPRNEFDNKELTNLMRVLVERFTSIPTTASVTLPGAAGAAGAAGTGGVGGAGGVGGVGGVAGASGASGASGAAGATGAAGLPAGVHRVDTTGLSNAFRDALMSQVKPMSEVFKTGMEQVFSKAFEEFRNEITETIRR